MQLEEMSAFFAARVDGYDEHMINDVGCAQCYEIIPDILPKDTSSLLDLGCGTGLELHWIFKRFPDISVTGIDLTKAMLDRLSEKFPGKNLRLINGDYFEVDFGTEQFDAVISVETMHHFPKSQKVELYKKIHSCLKKGGVYIECDYMIPDEIENAQQIEDYFFAEYKKLSAARAEGKYFHYDTPCKVSNQLEMFAEAGFSQSEKIFSLENTIIIKNVK